MNLRLIGFVAADYGSELSEMSSQLIFGSLLWREMADEYFLIVHVTCLHLDHYSIKNLIMHLYIVQNELFDFLKQTIFHNSMASAYDLYHLNLSDFDFFLIVAK